MGSGHVFTTPQSSPSPSILNSWRARRYRYFDGVSAGFCPGGRLFASIIFFIWSGCCCTAGLGALLPPDGSQPAIDRQLETNTVAHRPSRLIP